MSSRGGAHNPGLTAYSPREPSSSSRGRVTGPPPMAAVLTHPATPDVAEALNILVYPEAVPVTAATPARHQ